ncbi:acyltransferase [Paenibacillus solisilvae]|uniref:Acyltransferase n=1 Tax=Paenibacillus solisilvae TaxID=2486751 RepID=A0ABW0W001_9BACL
MNKLNKPRIEEIETLRGFAFLAVVMQHSIAHYFPLPGAGLADGVILGLILLLSKFAVPLFVFITGLVLFYNYDGEVRYSLFVRKRFKDIVLPYLPWAIWYAIVFQHLNLTDAGSISKLALLIVTGKASYHLWYIVMIVQFYLLFPLLQRVIRKWKPKGASIAAAAVVVLGVLYVLLMQQWGILYQWALRLDVPVLSSFFTKYLDRNALMFFFYFALGAAAGLYLEQWRTWMLRYRYWIIGIYGIMLCGMLFVVAAHFKLQPTITIRYDDLSLLRPQMAVLLTLSVMATYIFAMNFSRNAPGSLRKIITIAGAYSYTAYLAHAYVLRYTERAADFLFPDGSITLRTITAFLLCAAGALLLAFLLRKLSKRTGK